MRFIKKRPRLSWIASLLLFLAALLGSAAPVVLEQLNRPERTLAPSRWKTLAYALPESRWQPSDGSSAPYVNWKRKNFGVEITLQPTELLTREGYYLEDAAIPDDVFKLSAVVKVPEGCRSGLIFRGNERGEYYLFLVGSTVYTAEILRRKDNQDLPREAIIPNTIIPAWIGAPRELSVVGSGSAYFFYINRVYVGKIEHARLYGNRVGVEAMT